MRPNIVWICLDTARADALEPYGAPAGASPAVADLAGRGHAHAGARATASWTLPSHVSMFGGGLPRALGLADVAGLHPSGVKPLVEGLADRWLPEVLRRSGYRTGAVSSNTWISRVSGFQTGFDRFEEAVTRRNAAMAAPDRRSRLAWAREVAAARVDDGAAEAHRVLHGWLAEGSTDPFFWFVNLVECHSPYLPPRPYADLPLRQRLRAGEEARKHLTLWAVWRACATGELPPDDALERMRVGYRGAIRYMDNWCARLFEGLDRAGVLDDTLVIVSSDHGENFGEGGLVSHAFSLDERLIHVPLVTAGPGSETLGVRSLADLPRRLAELAGVTDHPYAGDDLPPLAVAQFDSPAHPVGDPRTDQTIQAWGLDDAGIGRITGSLTAVVDGQHKLLLHGGGESFFDLASDALEAAPLPADRLDADVVARLRASAGHPAAQAGAVRTADAPPADIAPDDLADLEERMRLLGYL